VLRCVVCICVSRKEERTDKTQRKEGGQKRELVSSSCREIYRRKVAWFASSTRVSTLAEECSDDYPG
jgi:hypothetical protein